MTTHTSLSVHKLAGDVLGLATDLTRNFPRSMRGLSSRIRDVCLSMLVLIARADAVRDKTPVLDELLEQLQVAEILFRVSLDKHFISPRQYARAADVCARVDHQTSGWRVSRAAEEQ